MYPRILASPGSREDPPDLIKDPRVRRRIATAASFQWGSDPPRSPGRSSSARDLLSALPASSFDPNRYRCSPPAAECSSLTAFDFPRTPKPTVTHTSPPSGNTASSASLRLFSLAPFTTGRVLQIHRAPLLRHVNLLDAPPGTAPSKTPAPRSPSGIVPAPPSPMHPFGPGPISIKWSADRRHRLIMFDHQKQVADLRKVPQESRSAARCPASAGRSSARPAHNTPPPASIPPASPVGCVAPRRRRGVPVLAVEGEVLQTHGFEEPEPRQQFLHDRLGDGLVLDPQPQLPKKLERIGDGHARELSDVPRKGSWDRGIMRDRVEPFLLDPLIP